MPLPRDRAWFAAKTYGWGWGLPLRWQGWVSMTVFLLALIAGSPLAARHVEWFIAYSMVLSAALAALCYWKGEAPRWRWGKDS